MLREQLAEMLLLHVQLVQLALERRIGVLEASNLYVADFIQRVVVDLFHGRYGLAVLVFIDRTVSDYAGNGY